MKTQTKTRAGGLRIVKHYITNKNAYHVN